MSNNPHKKLAKNNSFPIVCIGSSAGGLEALIALFNALPKNIDMAFVLVSHLEPQHKSALVEIISREAPLAICEAKNNMKIESSHVYIIQPNTRMAISHKRLKISARVKRVDGRYLPVDFFMVSLADEEKDKAIGVILSGTGNDGTLGAQAIKAKGGIVFAQDENTARYFGMPGSAIMSGSTDYVLDPKAIASKLVDISTHGNVKQPVKQSVKQSVKHPSVENGLMGILILLQELVGVDLFITNKTQLSVASL